MDMPRDGVAGEIVHRHVGGNVASVLDVGGFAKRRVGAGYVMMVAADHDRSDPVLPDQTVESQGDFNPIAGIGIQNARLRADDQLVAFGVFDPFVIVAIHAAPLRVQSRPGGLVCFAQIFRYCRDRHTQRNGTVAVIETKRSHDMLDVAGKSESVGGIVRIDGHIARSGVVNGLQKGVAVIPKTGALFAHFLDESVLPDQRFNELFAENAADFRSAGAGPRRRRAGRGVAAAIGVVAGGLVGGQFDGDPIFQDVFPEVDDVAMIGDGDRLSLCAILVDPTAI